MIKVRKNISDHIYEIIKSDILEGDLEFGDKIVEIDYSNKLNVSRTPLREAIKKLEIEGLIERLPNGRLRIMEMSTKRIEEIFQIRVALEDIILNSLMNSRESLIPLEENLSLTRLHINSENWEASKKLFAEYNNLFYKVSDLEFTTKILKSYDFIVSKLRKNSLKSPERIKAAFEEHQAIFKSLMDKDLEKAKELNRSHLMNSKNSILSSFEEKNS